MSLNKIEALADSLMALNNYLDPTSKAYALKNPLMLKSYSAVGKHSIDGEGYRTFDSLLGGYKAALFDLEKKIEGTSNSGLLSTDKLRNLLAVYSINKEEDILKVVYFLRKTISPDINALTPISYFKEL